MVRRAWQYFLVGWLPPLAVLAAIFLGVAAFGAPEPLQRDTQTKALIQTELDMKGVTLTLGSLTVSDSAGIRVFDFGSTNGTRINGKIGFGTTPIVRPSSTTDLRQALINLGLYTTGGATPLNLNGGAFTAASVTGTTGTFSSTMGITGNTTIGGTLGVTGAFTGSSLTLSGNEIVGGTLSVTGASTFAAISGTNGILSGTLGVTGNTTFGGTVGITGALNGSSAAFSGNGTVGGTLGITGNSTFGGTVGITGALSGSSASFSGNGTVGGTFGVTGTSTLAAVNATNGNFTGTFHAGGNADFDGSMDIAGDTTLGGTLDVATDAVIGNDLDVGRNLDVDGALAVAGAAQTNSLTVTNSSILQAVTATTIAASGNSTFGGTLGITGALSGSTAAFSGNATVGGTLGVTGNTTVGGTLAATGVISSAGQITNLDYIDVSKAPYSADMTGATNSASALNSAITAAAAAGKGVAIPDGILSIGSTIAITVPIRIKGERQAHYDFAAAGGTTIKWIGSSGGTMMTVTNVGPIGSGISNVLLDCNNLATFGLVWNGVTAGSIENVSVARFDGIGAGFHMTANTTFTNSRNNVKNLTLVSNNDGGSCLWLSGDLAGNSNSCFNNFENTFIIHGGTRDGIKLGFVDNITLVGTEIYRTPDVLGIPSTGAGVRVAPSEHVNFPGGNVFVRLSAGSGGWVQPGTTSLTSVPAIIYGYQFDNGEPAPVLNGTYLFWFDNGGSATLNGITLRSIVGSIRGSTAIRARAYNNADISIASGVATVVTLNSERWDTEAMHSTSTFTSRLTAQSAGSYSIVANASFDINGTGFRFVSIMLNNTTTLATTTIPAVSGNYTNIATTTTWDMGVGDYVEMVVAHSAGTAIDLRTESAFSPEFMMVRNP